MNKRDLIIGSHLPISGGIDKIPEKTGKMGGNAFQFFSHNPRSYKTDKTFSDQEVEDFQKALSANEIPRNHMFIHSGYLINMASEIDSPVYNKSYQLMKKELELCGRLGVQYLIVHPGSHKGAGAEEGRKRVKSFLNRLLKEADTEVLILLENVSPKGNNVGFTLESLADIIAAVESDSNIGVCYDTCHGFDAGYDIRKEEDVISLKKQFDEIIGSDRLKLVHLNDSKFDVGEKKDRHANIGEGYIGKEGFSVFLSSRYFSSIPLIMETPGDWKKHREEIKIISELERNNHAYRRFNP